ncbi:TonB-dependent receptor plug domain-containing protein [Sphingobium sp. TCM1]|uniref:TonB-dependent receptor plug domain-containing protein n=1 Tax=Sphingobium sp. TCM1 TaxID=453246 RepID=UPI0007F40568|nr:TonB-dependent receptor [Sphingobium sp. TCM1]OAN56404.1 TonB-dependent receptor [Sphingobium sp. TCM1]
MKFVTTISLIAITAAAPALAQAPDGEASALPGDAIIVTASRSGEGVKASQLGASVTVIDNATLEARQTRIVSDVLRDVPGIVVSRIGGVGGQTQVRLRGSESNHVLVLIDGIEAADPYYGEYDFGTLIADPAARIEILRGQQSSLYGSDAIGGVINYITLSGREAPGISGRIEGGSFGTVSGAARVAGAGDGLDYALSASYYDTDGYPTARGGSRDIGSQSLGTSGKLNWTPTDNIKLTGVVRYSLTKADTNNSEFDPSSPLFGYTVDSPGVRYRNEALYGLLSAQITGLDGRWISTLSGQFADTTRKGYASYGFDYGDKGRRYKGSLTSSLTLGTEAVTHRITGAVDVERESFRNLSSFAFMGKRHTDNLGVVGQYELTAGGLSLGGSVRYDENDRFDDTTTWRVQGSYLLPTGTRIRAAYGTGVKNPGYYELYGYMDGTYIGNPNLKPEKSEGWEAGLEQSVGGWATISATWFDSTLNNEIYTSYPAPDYVATPANRDTKSKQHGIEAFVSAQPLPQLRFDLAYTWLKAKEDGVREIRRPRHVASVNTTVTSADQRFATTLTIRYNGRTTDTAYTDPSYVPVTVSMREYVLVNLSLDYRMSRNVALFGRIENLADEQYEEVFSFATAGRAAYGGVRLTF